MITKVNKTIRHTNNYKQRKVHNVRETHSPEEIIVGNIKLF